MKKILVLVLAVVALLTFAACEEKPELLEVMPLFTGEPVTEIDYEFTKDDFTVYAIYAGDLTEVVDDYEFEVVKMSAGYFHVRFTYKGMENYCFVGCQYDIYS